MRPDIAWTPAVQSVLDKALARAVAARYQSASEFGRDFVLAVEAMLSPDVASPLSRTTEAIALPELESSSTAALAPTRVSDASGSANAESRGRTSRVIAGVGAAVLVAALAGSALVFSRRDVSAGREGVTRAGDAASQKGAAANTLSVDASLDSVEGLRYLEKNSASDARRAIAALDTLQQAPMTNAQRVRATILRAEARATLGENGSACQLMRDIDAAAATTNYGRRVRQFLRSGACS